MRIENLSVSLRKVPEKPKKELKKEEKGTKKQDIIGGLHVLTPARPGGESSLR